MREGVVLNAQHRRAYTHYDVEPVSKKLTDERVTQFMCQNFYDIRTFGAVMTTEVNCGQYVGRCNSISRGVSIPSFSRK